MQDGSPLQVETWKRWGVVDMAELVVCGLVRYVGFHFGKSGGSLKEVHSGIGPCVFGPWSVA